MLSYRHGFHAGNLADLLKHSVLLALLTAMQRKVSPITYIDTHAGSPGYDLSGAFASKGNEWRSGIGALWPLRGQDDMPQCLRDYLRNISGAEQPRDYLGSAAIAAKWLGANDQLWLADLHPTEFDALSDYFAFDRRVHMQKIDGYAWLRMRLPPQHTRALVLIDPAYEIDGEAERALAAVEDALTRFARGVYVLWYPLRGKIDVERFKRRARRLRVGKALMCELRPQQSLEKGPLGSGLIVLNPPFRLEEQLSELVGWLSTNLKNVVGEVSWLIAEKTV